MDTNHGGSNLDADHPQQGVNVPRLTTGLGELAGAQRVVGGDGVGVCHGGLRANGCRGRSASGRSGLRRDRAPLSLSPVQGKPDGWMAPVLAMRKPSAGRGVTPQKGGAGKAVGTSAAGPAAGSGEHIVMENWRDCRGLPRQRAHPFHHRMQPERPPGRLERRALGRANRRSIRVTPLNTSRAVCKTSKPSSPRLG